MLGRISLVQLQRVNSPIRLLESTRLVGNVIVTGGIASRSSTLLVPDTLIDVASAKRRVKNLQLSARFIHQTRRMESYNSLLLEVPSNIAVAIRIDKLRCSWLTPGTGLRLAVLDIGGNVVSREPPDLDGLCCQPGGVNASLISVEGLAVGA